MSSLYCVKYATLVINPTPKVERVMNIVIENTIGEFASKFYMRRTIFKYAIRQVVS